MLDPTVQMGAAPEVVAAGSPAMARPQALDPAETRSFALLMRDPSSPQTSSASVFAPAAASAAPPSALQRAIAAQGAEFSEGFDALDRSRQALTASTDMSDPMMTMWRAVDFSFQSTTLFTRLHIATGLSTAVSNSFNSLLKSQQ